tara:strand:+ start:822 stop:1085 length:264 start_codon:yes stop_codon:yes gene_type:complete
LKYKKKFNKKRKPRQKRMEGLQVEVYNNNVEGALKVLKKKVKESNLFLDLKKKSYYKKKSEILREKRNLSKLRNKYQVIKEKESKKY